MFAVAFEREGFCYCFFSFLIWEGLILTHTTPIAPIAPVANGPTVYAHLLSSTPILASRITSLVATTAVSSTVYVQLPFSTPILIRSVSIDPVSIFGTTQTSAVVPAHRSKTSADNDEFHLMMIMMLLLMILY